MQTLKRSLTQPLRILPNKVVIFLLVVAIFGFADASYLTVEHFANAIPPCTTSGCETVLTSAYSEILGVPVALLGALYYLTISIGIFAYLESKNEKLIRYALLLTPIGFLMSLWFISAMTFIIHSYCQYCLGSATTSTILFVTALYVFSKYRSTDTLTA